MNVIRTIRNWFSLSRNNVARDGGSLFVDARISAMNFATCLFLNVCDILTDICNDTTFTYSGGNNARFRAFKNFFDACGQQIMDKLYIDGFVVIDITSDFLFVMDQSEYNTVQRPDGSVVVFPIDDRRKIYVMKSPTYIATGKSDWQILHPYLRYANNVLNASSTANERMGIMLAVSPDWNSSLPTDITISKEEREEIEQELGGNDSKYGILRNQKSVALFPRPMRFQTISLASVDNKLIERLKVCVLAIADRIKVPANQIAFIDSNSSKTLANGSELREGDKSKYKSYRRMLNATFWHFAAYGLGLVGVDYIIDGEPQEA